MRTIEQIIDAPLPEMEADPVIQEAYVTAAHMGHNVLASPHFGYRLCGCGDCREAVAAALREYIKLRESGHCMFWPAQVAGALSMIATMELMLDAGATKEELLSPTGKDNMPEGISVARAEATKLSFHLFNVGTLSLSSHVFDMPSVDADVGRDVIEALDAMHKRTEARK